MSRLWGVKESAFNMLLHHVCSQTSRAVNHLMFIMYPYEHRTREREIRAIREHKLVCHNS